MAYQIDRYNNTLLTVVEDGTVDQTTDLKFIGKNYAGYGEIQNENFLYLLENFAGANQPARPISGQVWFDTAGSKLKFYDGSKWRTTGGAEIGSAEPTGLAVGDFWWDAGNDQLYVYNGTNFVLIGPQNAGEGVTQMQSVEVLDDVSGVSGIIEATIEDEVVMVISPREFTLSDATPINGFDRIKKGITLVNTKLDTSGVTSTPHYFWGTASNSLKLGGRDASEYVLTAAGENTVFNSVVEFPDEGLFVGNSQDFQFLVENGTEGVIQNITGNNSVIKLKATNATGGITTVATISATGLTPAVDNTFTLGSASLRWGTIYATNFTGLAEKASALVVNGNARAGDVSASNNSVAVRDATGNIAANLFQGTATQARYADLAEKYTTAEEYPVGTVMAVCSHEDHETEAANPSSIAIGVISHAPAYLMNSECDGQAIGLKGRVPVRVVGPVRKGQAVYCGDNGTANTTLNGCCLVGVALETNESDEEKLVECVLKV